jgi:adenosylcobinamide-phosphate synthase
MAFLIALLLDLFFGEPYNAVHPVVWSGKLIGFLDKRMPRNIAAGFFTVIIVCSAGLLVSLGVPHTGLFMFIIIPWLLTSTFSVTSLYTHVKRCDTDDMNELRRAASMIVSRNTDELSKEELYSAAIESLAENFVDGIISPLFYYILFGLPGALVYRCVNTMDAMIGYRTEKYEKFGKCAARLDDVLNFIPARLSVLIFAIISPGKCFKSAGKYGGIKINGTWSIACISGILDVRLRKQGVYDINPEAELPQRKDLQEALNVYWRIARFTILMVLLILFFAEKSFFNHFIFNGVLL